MIRNDNPDKGTETLSMSYLEGLYNRLEMITPIRGRKQVFACGDPGQLPPIRNDNPDKGTETL